MPESRRVYTADFKVAAVTLVTEQGRSIAGAARSLFISGKTVRWWMKAPTARRSDGFHI